MNSIRYLATHNPAAGTPTTDAENRRLCWAARHAETEGERLAARNELILKNQGLIVAQALVVRKVSRVPLDDLISEGQFALVKAIELFRFDEGVQFSTFATTCINRYIRRQSWIHGGEIVLPCHLHVSVAKRRGPLHDDADRARHLKSLSIPTAPSRVLADELPDRDSGLTVADAVANRAMLARLMGMLTSREREIIALRYGLGNGEPATLVEVGKVFKVSRERIRQIENQAVATMAEVMRKEMAG